MKFKKTQDGSLQVENKSEIPDLQKHEEINNEPWEGKVEIKNIGELDILYKDGNVYIDGTLITKELINDMKLIKSTFSGNVVGIGNKGMDIKEFYATIGCNYNSINRVIHPRVCEWHRDKNDKLCRQCERF